METPTNFTYGDQQDEVIIQMPITDIYWFFFVIFESLFFFI
ncbi:hypothetical protein PBR_2206 [Segatella baroniae B14]|uniref:Uncharacterized protein n=1 Tax=Segatella baroniae B14 TaxID=752555 RepID=D8DWX8_9BACT|nr:hypothetical protein PBR_2206 [Segatella baroniae B14]